MKLGYNTNGLAHHRLIDAINLLADERYASVAITLDAGVLDPYDDVGTLRRQIDAARALLDARGLSRVAETGARYLLNPSKKHDPTLLDPNPTRRDLRVDFLRRAIDIARELDAEAVSFWSGILPDADVVNEPAALDRLASALRPVLEHAEARRMRLAFEPEPGMFIDTFARFRQLDERVRHPLFDLTVDIGHVHCIEETPMRDCLCEWRGRIANIHIEDMNRGIHEHLMFGTGTIDFDDVFEALADIGYNQSVHVELSRHSHAAVEAVRASRSFLSRWIP